MSTGKDQRRNLPTSDVVLAVACPRCRARAGETCVARRQGRATGRAAQVHEARWHAFQVATVASGAEIIEELGPDQRRRLMVLGENNLLAWVYEERRRCGICGVSEWKPGGFDAIDGWQRSVRVCDWHVDYCPEHAEMGGEFDKTLRMTLVGDAEAMLEQLSIRVARQR